MTEYVKWITTNSKHNQRPKENNVKNSKNQYIKRRNSQKEREFKKWQQQWDTTLNGGWTYRLIADEKKENEGGYEVLSNTIHNRTWELQIVSEENREEQRHSLYLM